MEVLGGRDGGKNEAEGGEVKVVRGPRAGWKQFGRVQGGF